MRLENVEDIYPLSPAQQGMLFHDLYAPQSGVYCVQLSFAIHGRLDVDAFQRSWQSVLDRHPALRTVFAWEGLDQPLQIVRKQVELPWTLAQWPPAGADAASFDEFLHADRLRGFDLTRAPLMRAALVRMSDDEWRCVWSHHHLILDGWSVGLVLHDVLACYLAFTQGREPAWRTGRPYRDYIAWLQRQDLARADAFWREQLRGITAATPLAIARTPQPDSSEGHFHAEVRLQLPADFTAQLQSFARQHRLTLNTLVSGALAMCLARYAGQSEIVLGTTVSGRPTDLPGAESMVGMFINTLPLRVPMVYGSTAASRVSIDSRAINGLPASAQPCLIGWLTNLQSRQAALTPFAATPLVRIQSQTPIPAGQPLFETILVFENYPVDSSGLRQLAAATPAESGSKLPHSSNQGPADLSISGLRGMEQTNYPLAVYAVPGPQLTLRIGYDRRRIDDDAASRMLGHLRTILEQFLARPQAAPADIELLDADERRLIIEHFNQTTAPIPPLAVHQLFEAQAARTPDAIAAICGQDGCTYAELNRRSNTIAHRLTSLGVGREDRVGICLHRSIDMLAAVLGVLEAGGAYVPLDPAFPRRRLAMMLEDAGPRAIITQKELADVLPATSAVLVTVGGEESNGTPGIAVGPDHAAYVIFTSGSTGRPKGVVIEHRAAVNFLASMARQPGLAATDTLVAVTTLSFDIAGLELLLPLTVGAKVVIATAEQAADPEALRGLLDEHRATVMQATPATWRMLLESGWAGRANLRILCGGEALTRELADRLRPCGSELWNLYGPTETTIWSSAQQISPGDAITIGRPIANTRMYVLDARLQPVPVGIAGELYIAGAGVARGYLNRPDLTAERFLADPFAPGRMYGTGDLARYRSDGRLECLGRVDHQVKIRGFRIELGDIEFAMAQHPAVRQAVVIDREDAPGEKQLVAYWIASDGAFPSGDDLRQHLRDKLPDYMLPSAFVRLESLPLTPNGKIDRRALPAPTGEREPLAHAYVAPRDADEQRLADIWSQLLNRSPIGVHDNFFELGGHSLVATRLVSRIRDQMGVSLPLRTVFEAPTIAGLAERIRAAAPSPGASDTIAADVVEGRI